MAMDLKLCPNQVTSANYWLLPLTNSMTSYAAALSVLSLGRSLRHGWVSCLSVRLLLLNEQNFSNCCGLIGFGQPSKIIIRL